MIDELDAMQLALADGDSGKTRDEILNYGSIEIAEESA